MRHIAGLLFVLILLVSCADEPTLEQQIIATITEMEALAEEGKRGAFMDMVATEFNGQLGILTRDEFRRFMIMQWNEHQRLHAQLFPIRVLTAGPGRATAEFNALITGGRGLIPDSGQLYAFRTTWLQDGKDWLLLGAQWEPVRLD
jgi:hypothetical protein